MGNKASMEYKGRRFELEWIKDSDFEKYEPIIQVYGIIYDKDMNVLIGRKNSEKPWALMGGTPEEGEGLLGTLERELIEEADVTFKNPVFLGVQRVVELDGEGKPIDEPFYQSRVVAELDQVLEQTLDPDKGTMWERKFVPIDEVESYLQWGSAAVAMIADAKEIIEEALKKA
jgi:ADP-ribose pyrophosphatase YjhB (NUDIX family)